MMVGDGGTPPAPAGYVPPSQPGVAAGSATGLVRARTVIVSGPTGTIEGIFMYAPGTTPGPGNPPIVAMTTAATDPYGNTVQPADSPATSPEFIVLGTAGSYAQIAAQTGLASLLLGTGDGSETSPGFINSAVIGAGGTRQLATEIQSPNFTGNPAAIQVISQSQDLSVTSQINLNCINRTNFGISAAAWWADGTQQLNLPAAGGPFIFNEGFHTITNPANYNGTARVKLLPWNAVWLDVELNGTVNSSGGVSLTLGSLPSAAYYPTVQRHFPMSMTGAFVTTSGSFAGNVRLLMPTSGAVHIEIPSLAASALLTLACSVIYPTN